MSNAGSKNLFAVVGAGTNTTGSNNSFVGSFAGQLNTTGDSNSFVGQSAGQANTTGNFNSFIGRSAGYLNTTGQQNSFFGVNAGFSNTTGYENSIVGTGAGFSNTTGQQNSFFGQNAGQANTTGFGNSFFGNGAGFSNTTGGNNTIIGVNANVGSGALTFATAIGSGAIVSASNTIALGRTDGSDRVVVYGLGAAGSTTLCRNASNQISTCSSSLRYKTNIAPFSFGLNLVKQLQPISYDWKADEMKDVGFGAEDVAAINPLFVNYNSKGEVEGVKYDRLSVVFVNAFKEQQTQIEAQQKRIDAQAQQIAERNQSDKEEINQLREQVSQQQTVIDGLKKIVCAGNPNAEICRQKKQK